MGARIMNASNDQSDRDWLDRILPVIRVRDYRLLRFGPKRKEILGLYPTQLVHLRIKASTPIPESVYQPEKADELVALGKAN